MARRSKRLDRIRNNPRDVSFDDLRRVLQDQGFVLLRSRGSHQVFAVPGTNPILTIAERDPVKPPYVRKALAMIDSLEEE